MIEQERMLFNPFPGLRPFETDENYLFFGRDGQSDEVLRKLRTARFVAVVGTSGSGKSSLVRAGLLPALYSGHMTNAGSSWRTAIFRPGNTPVSSLAKALSEPAVFGAKAGESAEVRLMNIERTLRRSSLGLLEVVAQARMAPHENLLILADQFEELFRFRKKTTDAHPTDEAAAFVKLLLEAKQLAKSPEEKLPIYVILTMRSDYLGECAHFWGLPEAINEGQYLIPRMTDDDRREAIIGPAIISGAEISPTLVNRLLNDAGDDPARLPILQHALLRTWDYWKTRSEPATPIDIPHYERIGSMSEALSNHADEAFLELSPESQKIAEKLFKCLTEREADNREGRRPATIAEICAVTEAGENQVKSVIENFRREGRSFLMPPPTIPLATDTLIDISHESLISGWQRLKKWVGEEAQSARQYLRLADTAALFPEQQGYLRDPALQIGLNWLEDNKPTISWALRYHPGFYKTIEFLKESRINREAEIAEKERQQKEKVEQELKHAAAIAAEQKRRVKQLRLGLFLLSLLLLVMLGLTVFAFQQRNYALQQKGEANTQRDRAESALTDVEVQRDTAQRAEIVAQVQSHRAIEALEEVELERDNARKARDEANKQRTIAEEALIQARIDRVNALKSEEAALVARKEAEVQREEAEERRDEAKKALATVNEIDRSAPYFKAIMRGHDAEVRSVALSPDASRLVTTSKDGTAHIYDVATGDSVMSYAHDGSVASATFSHDGKLIATADEDGQLGIWDPQTHQTVRIIGSKAKRRSVIFGPDDKVIASISSPAPSSDTISSAAVAQTAVPSASVVELWNISGGKMATLSGHNGGINSFEFSPDGRLALTASADSTARVWDTASGQSVKELRGHLSEVNSASFSPDGKFIVTASTDGKAHVWDVATGASLTELGGHDGKVNSASFSPNGRYIVTTSKNRAFLWESKEPNKWTEVSANSPTLLAGHTDEVTNATFSGDSKWVIAISKDRTAQLWKAEIPSSASASSRDRALLGGPVSSTRAVASRAVFRGHIKPVTSIAVSKDSKYFVTGSEDRTARVWDMTGIGVFNIAKVELKAEPSEYNGECPITVKFIGTISVEGGSGTVKYKFVRNDGTESLPQELYFDAPGSKQVSETREAFWKGVSRSNIPIPTSGWVEIQIIEPFEAKSNQAKFIVRCQQSAQHLSIPSEELSSTKLKQIMPNSSDDRVRTYLPYLRQAMQEFGINTPLRQAAFLSEVAYNTGELRFMEEPGSDAELERRYGGRKDLGNFQSGEGTRYKGRGAFLLTGRSNYQAYGQQLGVDLITYPEQAASPELAFRTAAIFWQKNGLNELADKSDLASIRRRINAGIQGLEMVQAYFERAKSALGAQ